MLNLPSKVRLRYLGLLKKATVDAVLGEHGTRKAQVLFLEVKL